jgi:hypothetical protein
MLLKFLLTSIPATGIFHTGEPSITPGQFHQSARLARTFFLPFQTLQRKDKLKEGN